jgi:hypothetical protein
MVRCVPRTMSPVVKQQGHKGNNSPPSSRNIGKGGVAPPLPVKPSTQTRLCLLPSDGIDKTWSYASTSPSTFMASLLEQTKGQFCFHCLRKCNAKVPKIPSDSGCVTLIGHYIDQALRTVMTRHQEVAWFERRLSLITPTGNNYKPSERAAVISGRLNCRVGVSNAHGVLKQWLEILSLHLVPLKIKTCSTSWTRVHSATWVQLRSYLEEKVAAQA